VYQGRPGAFLAYHVVARELAGELVIGLVMTPSEGDHLRIPGHRFDYKLVPQRQARDAISKALPTFVDQGPTVVRGGVRFVGRLADDDPNWRDHLHLLMDSFLSALHGAIWPTFSHKQVFAAQRWAWMAEWFSHANFNFEVERYKDGASWLTDQGWVRRPMTHEEAVATATDRLTREGSGWKAAKWPDDQIGLATLSKHELQRCVAIVARAEQLRAVLEHDLGPPHLDIRLLRKPRWATLQQHLCHHFVETEKMTWRQAADVLGIATPQEVGRAVKKYQNAQAKVAASGAA
jgi:hypothetical protein